jgi:hypothetical protein
MRAVKMLSTANGRSTVRSCATLLIIRPAAIRSPHDTATSPITMIDVIRPIRRPEDPRPSSLSASFIPLPVARRAGNRPAARADKAVITITNSMTWESRSKLIQKGGGLEATPRLNQARPPTAISIPMAAPASERTPTSIRSWRMTRTRLAPRAERTATSFSRPAARANRRLATFAHPMSSTPIAAPSIAMRSPNSSSPMTNFVNGSTTGAKPSLASGYCVSSRSPMVANSAEARSSETPSRRRPNPGSCGPSPRSCSSGFTSSGAHMSASIGNLNPSGATPTIVRDSPLVRTTCPKTSGDPSNCSCHTS